ncbi:ATP-binding cassette domain-containing protein, partial [Patescibacteria group bacterium]|nr:ATP-binding cassette domain-containing protein [Patescibacteria group bacterium]
MNKKYGIIIDQLSLSTEKVLIEDASFSITNGQKIALIGRNGSGKTCLLELINSLISNKKIPDYIKIKGKISFLPDTRIAYIKQKFILDTLNQYEHLSRINKEIDILKFNNRDMQNILTGFDLDEHILNKEVQDMSQGERMKIIIAKTLFSNPNFIMLDEPTNGLDYESKFFLSNYIQNTESSILLVSHDRDFIDNTVDRILEIDEHTRKIITFGGNYSFYKEQKDNIYTNELKDYYDKNKKLKKLKKEVNRLREKAFSEKSKRKARILSEKIEKKDIYMPKLPKKSHFVLNVNNTNKKNLFLECKNCKFNYNKRKIFDAIDIKVYANERILLIGKNGSGKSTLLNIFNKKLKFNTGKLYVNKEIISQYIPQNLEIEDKNINLLDHINSETKEIPDSEIKTIIGSLLFKDASKTKLIELSVGELKKIELIKLFSNYSNFIMIDELTNHLDLYTIESLENSLNTYPGGFIIATHDTRLIRNISIHI